MSEGKNSVPNTNAGKHGGRLRRGNPGNKGGGRKTLEFKAECARLADEEVLPKIAAYLARTEPDDPAWRWAAQTVLEYSKQKIANQVNLGSTDGTAMSFTLNLGAATVTDDGDR